MICFVCCIQQVCSFMFLRGRVAARRQAWGSRGAKVLLLLPTAAAAALLLPSWPVPPCPTYLQGVVLFVFFKKTMRGRRSCSSTQYIRDIYLATPCQLLDEPGDDTVFLTHICYNMCILLHTYSSSSRIYIYMYIMLLRFWTMNGWRCSVLFCFVWFVSGTFVCVCLCCLCLSDVDASSLWYTCFFCFFREKRNVGLS